MDPSLQANYLQNPTRCPYCDSVNIVDQLVEGEDKQIWREVNCLNRKCLKAWREVYALQEVKEVK